MALGEMTDAMGDGVEANHTGALQFLRLTRLRCDFRSSLKLRRVGVASTAATTPATATGWLSPEAKERLS